MKEQGRAAALPPIWIYDATLRDLSERLACDVAVQLRDAVAKRGQAAIAVPGGSTPRDFLTMLARADLPWPQITLLLTDERCVPPDHERSNEQMLRSILPEPVAERLLSFHIPGMSAIHAARVLSEKVAGIAPPDVLVSGMGNDAHIASIFPNDAVAFGALPEAAHVLHVQPPSLEPRLTLAPEILHTARWRALLISGREKIDVLKTAFDGADDARAHPVRLLLSAESPLRIYAAQA